MGFFSGLVQAVVDTASMPIDVVKDICEGGENNRSGKKVKKILIKDIGSIVNGEL